VNARIWSHPLRALIALSVVGLSLAAAPAHALNIGYYELCFGEGQPLQASAITTAGHTPVLLTNLAPADLAPVDIIMIDNCDNGLYAQEFVDHVGDVADAVASGKTLMFHDRYVDIAESVLPGGSTFDIQRHLEFPDPLNESRDINVLDGSTLITNGPAGTITDTTLDNGNYSNHGFAIAGSLPGTAKLVLSTNVPSHIVTFLYTYGAGAVMYSSIPLDHYRPTSTPFATIYGINVVHYAAYLAGSCGNGETDPGEDCDLAGANGGAGTCCTVGCGFVSAGTECNASTGACDPAETCTGASGLCPADEIATAGETCRAAAGECDVAESCDGVTVDCPADAFETAGTACADDGDLCTEDECDGAGTCEHPGKPDSDVDGTCDEQDACTNVGGGQNFVAAKPRPNVTLTKINADVTPGNDGLKINGEFQLGVGATFAGLAPNVTGARIVVESDAGVERVDVALPGGAYGGRGTRGWRVNPKGNVWTYTDATTSPVGGIKKVKVTDRSKTAPRRVRVSVGGAKSTYPVVAADAPVLATVVLGDQASAAAGACGETAFGLASCALNGPGTTLVCR